MPWLDSISFLLEKKFPSSKNYILFEDIGLPHPVIIQSFSYPFRHIIIDDFLPSDANTALREQFDQILSRSVSEKKDLSRFVRREMYDVDIFWPQPRLDDAHRYFFSLRYFEMLRKFLKAPISNDTILMYHHHDENKEDNYIHNDYLGGFFMEDSLQNDINPWYFQCTHSAPPQSENKSRKMMRSAAAIYYLNENWDEKQRGETGLFWKNDPRFLAKKIAPLNNRLLVFEVTPFSWHNFMKNNMPSRNSIAQWFFISENDANKRFPNEHPWEGSVGY
jgi:2OG-Fe(II) oxygenase superfamily